MWTQLLGLAMSAMGSQQGKKSGGSEPGVEQAKGLTQQSSDAFSSEMDQLAQGTANTENNIGQLQSVQGSSVLPAKDWQFSQNQPVGGQSPFLGQKIDSEFGDQPPSVQQFGVPGQQGAEQMASPMDSLSYPVVAQQGALQQAQPQMPTAQPWQSLPQQGGQQAAPNWQSLMNPTGTFDNPNMFVRAGAGYNQGGLMGALGYLLTDMNKQKPQQPQQPMP